MSDVLIGVRPESVYIAALEAQPLEGRAGIWRLLAIGRDRLDGLHPRNLKEWQRGWADPKDQAAYKTHYVALLRTRFDRLEEPAESAARAALAETTPSDVRDDHLRFTALDCLRLATLDGLAQSAKKRGGVLGSEHDAVIDDIARANRVSPERLELFFEALPSERACELTGLHHVLLPLYPSESGLRRLVEKMSTDVEWQSPKGSWAKIAAKLAAKFPAFALPLLKSAQPELKRFPDGLDAAIAAAEKAAATKPAKPKS